MFLKKTSDVIIIGSGIVGNSLALALSKMKYKGTFNRVWN